MAEGTIKKLTDKGFGFIKTTTDKDIFFHSKALQGVEFDDLQEGQKVTYTEGQLIGEVLQYLRRQVQLVIGYAVSPDDIVKFLKGRNVSP